MSQAETNRGPPNKRFWAFWRRGYNQGLRVIVLSDIRRMVHLVRTPHQTMPFFFDHPPAVHLSFARLVVPLALVRPLAIILRSWAQSAFVPGLVMAIAALCLQVLSWACFGWALVGLTRLWGYKTTERQAFALSTAVSAPLWLGGVLYLVPEEPPVLFAVCRLLVLLCGAWGVVMLAYAPFAGTGQIATKRAALVALASATYAIIYTLFFVTTGLLATLATLYLQAA